VLGPLGGNDRLPERTWKIERCDRFVLLLRGAPSRIGRRLAQIVAIACASRRPPARKDVLIRRPDWSPAN